MSGDDDDYDEQHDTMWADVVCEWMCPTAAHSYRAHKGKDLCIMYNHLSPRLDFKFLGNTILEFCQWKWNKNVERNREVKSQNENKKIRKCWN